MRYSPLLYAKSLLEVLEGSKPSEQEKIFKNFWNTVKKNGDQSRIDTIAGAFEGLVVKSNGGRMINIETAREVSVDQKKELSDLFKSHDLIKRKIDPALVAGIRVEVDGEMELDYSLARKFRKML